MKLRVGLVGLGDLWNTRHRLALMALSDRFDVRAICCEVADRAKQVAEDFGAEAVDGFQELVRRPDIDAILSLASDWVGPLPIIAACEAGKAVYSSAVLDVAPDEAADIRRRIDESGVAFMIELPRRYSPATLRLKELIATRLGKPRLMFCHERLPVEDQSNRLRRGKVLKLVWRNLMEQVDWCRYIIDREPISVTSSTFEPPNHEKDIFYQSMSLQFESSENSPVHPMAQISIGHYIPRDWREALGYRRAASIQVCCENGMAFIDLPTKLVWFDDAGQHTESLESERPVGEQMLCQFHRAVTSLIRKTTDLKDAYTALKVVLAANESSIRGQRLEF